VASGADWVNVIPPLFEVRNLCVHIPTSAGLARAVDGISFHLESGQTLGIVGESGCGKATVALALLNPIYSLGRQISKQ
jgi:peptide/nickel transport system ATP-binding protein